MLVLWPCTLESFSVASSARDGLTGIGSWFHETIPSMFARDLRQIIFFLLSKELFNCLALVGVGVCLNS